MHNAIIFVIFIALCNVLEVAVIKESDGREKTILDSINEGVFTVDLDWRITGFNRAAEKITHVSRKEAIGRQCCDVFRASICENACALRRTMSSGTIQMLSNHLS